MLSDGSDGKPTEQIHLLFISVAKWHLEKLAFGTYTYKINTPPGAKLGLCRRTIYSKLSTSDHNLFQIFLREYKFFFEHQISVTANHCRGIKRKVGAGEIGI